MRQADPQRRNPHVHGGTTDGRYTQHPGRVMPTREHITTEIAASTISGLPVLAVREDGDYSGGYLIAPDPNYVFRADWVPQEWFINFINACQVHKEVWDATLVEFMFDPDNGTGCHIHLATPKP